jgi:hypothetical protein
MMLAHDGSSGGGGTEDGSGGGDVFAGPLLSPAVEQAARAATIAAATATASAGAVEQAAVPGAGAEYAPPPCAIAVPLRLPGGGDETAALVPPRCVSRPVLAAAAGASPVDPGLSAAVVGALRALYQRAPGALPSLPAAPFLTPLGLRVDAAWPEQALLLEVEGPRRFLPLPARSQDAVLRPTGSLPGSHYATTPPDDVAVGRLVGRRRTPAAAAKLALLSAAGYRVATLRFDEWEVVAAAAAARGDTKAGGSGGGAPAAAVERLLLDRLRAAASGPEQQTHAASPSPAAVSAAVATEGRSEPPIDIAS